MESATGVRDWSGLFRIFVNYYVIFLLTGNGEFVSYLYRFKLRTNWTLWSNVLLLFKVAPGEERTGEHIEMCVGDNCINKSNATTETVLWSYYEICKINLFAEGRGEKCSRGLDWSEEGKKKLRRLLPEIIWVESVMVLWTKKRLRIFVGKKNEPEVPHPVLNEFLPPKKEEKWGSNFFIIKLNQ